MTQSSRTCPLCRSSGFHTLYRIHQRTLIRCEGCGLVSYRPLPTGEELSALYDSEAYFESQYFSVDDQALDTTHFRHLSSVIPDAERLCSQRRPLLDVGPGAGVLLRLCADNGIPAEGLEFSSPAAAKLREATGMTIHHGTLEKQAASRAKYGMLCAFDVIEHCPDITGWLRAAFHLLDSGGLFHLSTVNIDNALDGIGKSLYRLGFSGSAKRLYPPFHLFYFTPKTLRAALEQAGFEIIRHTQENYDVRKATASKAMRLALRAIYMVHDLTGKKTNQYVLAKKP